MRKGLGALLLAGVVWGGIALFGGGPSGPPPRETVAVRRGEIVQKVVASGKIHPRQEVHVRSPIAGVVERCFVKVGDTVEKGSPLFEITPNPTPLERSDLARQVERARVELDHAGTSRDRVLTLHKEGFASRSELDVQEQAFQNARITFQQAQERFALGIEGRIEHEGVGFESVIRAPAAGTVLVRYVNSGDPVVPLTSYQQGTDLLILADMRDLIVKADVDEIDIGKLRIGMEARLLIASLPAADVRGTLSEIAPRSKETASGSFFEVEIDLIQTGETLLRAGYSANAHLIVEQRKDVPMIPERLVVFEKGSQGTFVEIPSKDPKEPYRRIPFAAGLSDGLQIEVVEGLSEGDLVAEHDPGGTGKDPKAK